MLLSFLKWLQSSEFISNFLICRCVRRCILYLKRCVVDRHKGFGFDWRDMNRVQVHSLVDVLHSWHWKISCIRDTHRFQNLPCVSFVRHMKVLVRFGKNSVKFFLSSWNVSILFFSILPSVKTTRFLCILLFVSTRTNISWVFPLAVTHRVLALSRILLTLLATETHFWLIFMWI